MNKFTCSLGLVFLIANIFTMFCVDKCDNKQKFMDMLSEEQKKKYNKIICERRRIYFMGYSFGLFVSIISIFNETNNLKRVCMSGAITMIISYLFYILYPKSDYMILHLNDKKKRKVWLDIYKQMQKRYHYGLLFGIFSVILLSIN